MNDVYFKTISQKLKKQNKYGMAMQEIPDYNAINIIIMFKKKKIFLNNKSKQYNKTVLMELQGKIPNIWI